MKEQKDGVRVAEGLLLLEIRGSSGIENQDYVVLQYIEVTVP